MKRFPFGQKSILFILALLVAASLTAARAGTTAENERSQPTKDQVLASVEDHYSRLTDLTAKVVQQNYLKSVDKRQRFEGTLTIKKPGRLRLAYTDGQLVVIDHREIWIYSRANAQAIRRTFRDFEQANIPVAFLLGAGSIRKDFEVTLVPADIPVSVLDLVPRKRGAAMKKLRLLVDNSGSITRMIIFDRSGNMTDILFAGVKENTGVPDSLFRFKAPKGTEIIEQQ